MIEITVELRVSVKDYQKVTMLAASTLRVVLGSVVLIEEAKLREGIHLVLDA